MFFYLYMLVTIMDLLLISGIIPTASNLYPVRLLSCSCLLLHSLRTVKKETVLTISTQLFNAQ